MIVIPMAGESRRFAEAGYGVAKYRLMLAGRSVFDHAVASFEAYFHTRPFLFVVRAGEGAFVADACARLGVAEARVAELAGPTAGQAETVALGLQSADIADDACMTIFNIDTFRPGFRFPEADWASDSDGWLEVFRGAGANWSYVRPAGGPEPRVLETAEKRPLSDLCCTGLYHFRRCGDFRAALESERARPSAPELYVAPLYNALIAAGRRIHYRLIDAGEAVFCGVPAEYEALKAALG